MNFVFQVVETESVMSGNLFCQIIGFGMYGGIIQGVGAVFYA